MLQIEIVATFACGAFGELVEDEFGVLMRLAVVADLITCLVRLIHGELGLVVLLIRGVFQVLTTHRQDHLIRSLSAALTHARTSQGLIRARVEIL